jgi:hypothetical protein
LNRIRAGKQGCKYLASHFAAQGVTGAVVKDWDSLSKSGHDGSIRGHLSKIIPNLSFAVLNNINGLRRKNSKNMLPVASRHVSGIIRQPYHKFRFSERHFWKKAALPICAFKAPSASSRGLGPIIERLAPAAASRCPKKAKRNDGILFDSNAKAKFPSGLVAPSRPHFIAFGL